MIERLLLAAIVHIVLTVPAFAFDCDGGTQREMNQCAGKAFEKADAVLNARYKKIIGCLKEKAEPLVEAQRAWINFRDAECRFQGSATEGGSIQPLVVAGCLKAITDERAKALDFYLTCEEGDLSCPTVTCNFPKPAQPK